MLSTAIPSTIHKGSFPAPKLVIPLTLMVAADPGCPELETTETPDALPEEPVLVFRQEHFQVL